MWITPPYLVLTPQAPSQWTCALICRGRVGTSTVSLIRGPRPGSPPNHRFGGVGISAAFLGRSLQADLGQAAQEKLLVAPDDRLALEDTAVGGCHDVHLPGGEDLLEVVLQLAGTRPGEPEELAQQVLPDLLVGHGVGGLVLDDGTGAGAVHGGVAEEVGGEKRARRRVVRPERSQRAQ